MDRNTLEITMTASLSNIKMLGQGGGLVSKAIPTVDLIPMINRAMPAAGGTSIELLPANLRLLCKRGDITILGFMHPERIGDFTWYCDPEETDVDEDDYEWTTWRVKYPYSMTFIRLDRQSANSFVPSKYWQFALKNPLVGMDDMMYRWPGPNVYNDYSCCMGDNQNAFTPVPSIAAAGSLQYQFINGVNNNDLSGECFMTFNHEGRRINHPLKLFYRVLNADTNANPQFPYDCLRNAMTVSSFLSGIGIS